MKRQSATHWFATTLIALLIGCSQSPVVEESETTVYQAGEIDLLQIDTLPQDKAATVFDDDFDPFQPYTVSFLLEASDRLRLEEHALGFYAARNSVAQDTEIDGRWLGPEGHFGYDMQPHGLNFNRPVRFTIDVQWVLDLGIYDPSRLVLLLDNEDGTYNLIPSNLRSGNIRAMLHHFSKYVIGIGPPPSGNGHR